MRFNKSKMILFLSLLVSGCSYVSKQEMAELYSPVELNESIDLALQKNFFEEGGWPNENWWEMFQDPQLNGLMQVALQKSPTLQKAFAKVQEVEQLAKRERAALFPHLNLKYNEQWTYFSKNGFVRSFYPLPAGVEVPPKMNDLNLTLNFNYELDFFGRNRKRFEESLGHARAARAEAQAATLILTTLIAQTYVELQTKRAQKKILKQHIEERNQTYALIGKRAKKGLEPEIPVLQKKQEIYTVDQSLILLDKEILIDLHALNRLIGVGPEENLLSDEMSAIFEKPFPLPTQLSSNLLARRPDLTAQLWRVESAAKGIGAAQADFYPRINLMAFGGFESLSFTQLLNISSKQGALEPAIYLPIFVGGKLRANLKEKVAIFNEATHHYNELLLSAATEVADQIATLCATYEMLNSQLNTFQTIEDQLLLEYARYKGAISNFLSVLSKEDTFLHEQYRLLGFERDYLFAVIKLIKALGGGYCASQLPSTISHTNAGSIW